MATEFFLKLWDNHIIQLGVWQTVYMTFLTSLFAYVIGLPLGVVLWVTDKDGLHPNKGVNTVLGFIVNFFRSIPAVILMVAMIPVARILLGTSTGNGAVIVTLIIAAAPYVARMDFIIGVQAKAPHNCGVVSWDGTMYINMIRNIREPELESHFYRVLHTLGLPVKVESNQRWT